MQLGLNVGGGRPVRWVEKWVRNIMDELGGCLVGMWLGLVYGSLVFGGRLLEEMFVFGKDVLVADTNSSIIKMALLL